MLTVASISAGVGFRRAGYRTAIDDERLPPDRPTRPRALLAAIGLLLLFVLVQVVATVLVTGVAGDVLDVRGSLGVREVMGVLALQLAGLLVGAALVVQRPEGWGGVGLASFGGGAGWRALVPLGALVVLPTVAYALAQGDPLIDASVTPARAVAYALLALAIGLNEEIWFRGLILQRLGGAARPWFAAVASSVLFGLPHLDGSAATLLNAGGVTLAIGLPFALVRMRCGALAPLVGWHAVVDLWAFLHTASVVAEGDPSPADVATGLVLPACIALGYVVWFRRTEPA